MFLIRVLFHAGARASASAAPGAWCQSQALAPALVPALALGAGRQRPSTGAWLRRRAAQRALREAEDEATRRDAAAADAARAAAEARANVEQLRLKTKMQIPPVGAEVEVLFTEPLDGSKRWAVGEVIQSDEAQVRNIPRWPRSWANFSLF